MNITSIIKKLIQSPEDEVLELKSAKDSFDFDDLGKYFSAISNESNLKNKEGGWIIFGVEDNPRNICGSNFKSGKDSLSKLKFDIANHTTDRITFLDIYEDLKIKKGKRVILFKVPPAPKGMPISWKGHYYARDGENLVPLNIEKLERIRGQEVNNDWSAKSCIEATIDDLDKEAIKKARAGFTRKNPSLTEAEIMEWSDEVFLNKAKITIRSNITRAAILLLGKSESEHFISPATAKISWVLKDQNNIEKDYEHFTCPLIISVDKVYQKIRNLRYRYMSDGSLFSEEIDRYDPLTIKEAINNCIAHQDYSLGGKINLVENEDGSLIFTNLGSFIPETIENVINSDSSPEYYRNKFLANAMVNVNMIDTIGSGIRKMFNSQRKKFFPLPEYDLSRGKVKLTIIGKVLDIQYAKKLAQIPNLDLKTIIALDKVQKRKRLTNLESKELRNQGLIEGRIPNVYISSKVAIETGEQSDYIKMRGFKDDHYKKMILEYLEKYATAAKKDIDKLILDVLPKILDEQQQKNKVRNIVYAMSKMDKTIVNIGTTRYPKWKKV